MMFYSNTDIGMIRDLNEDYYDNLIDENWALFVVADGMGGHKAGEVASMMAVETIKKTMSEKMTKDGNRLEDLEEAIQIANDKIHQYSEKSPECRDMGTTIVTALVEDNHLYLANVGDSRAYLLNEHGFKQISRDHSLVNEMLASGSITEEEAKNYSRKNIITRSVGLEGDVEAETLALELNAGDQLLLCTDGLNGLVEDSVIEETLRKDVDLEEKVEHLIDLANDNGGNDNITVTLVLNKEVAE